MPQNYTPEFKKKIVRLHLEEGRTYKSITAEYGVSKARVSLQSMAYQKPVSPSGAVNSAENARQARK